MHVDAASRDVLWGTVLGASFPASVRYCRSGWPRARDAISAIWWSQARLLGLSIREPAGPQVTAPPLLKTLATALARSAADEGPVDAVWVETFNVALGELLYDRLAAGEARFALQRLRTSLRLSYAELGRMFGVSDESARRWERGLTAVPVAHKPRIDEAHGALRRLLGLFRASRLPAVIRRPADVFGGKTALDWILDGRIGEVASHYERALLYQPR